MIFLKRPYQLEIGCSSDLSSNLHCGPAGCCASNPATMGAEKEGNLREMRIITTAPPAFNNFYKTKMCERNGGGPCAWGDSCNFAHSVEELKPSYDLTKTKMCPRHKAAGVCNKYGCRYAHSSSELRSTEMFYKTQLCIDFTSGKECVNGDNCRHAHGLHELRKGPQPLYTLQNPVKFGKAHRRNKTGNRSRGGSRAASIADPPLAVRQSSVSNPIEIDFHLLDALLPTRQAAVPIRTTTIERDLQLLNPHPSERFLFLCDGNQECTTTGWPGAPIDLLTAHVESVQETPNQMLLPTPDQSTADSLFRCATEDLIGLRPPPGFEISEKEHKRNLERLLEDLSSSPSTGLPDSTELSPFTPFGPFAIPEYQGKDSVPDLGVPRCPLLLIEPIVGMPMTPALHGEEPLKAGWISALVSSPCLTPSCYGGAAKKETKVQVHRTAPAPPPTPQGPPKRQTGCAAVQVYVEELPTSQVRHALERGVHAVQRKQPVAHVQEVQNPSERGTPVQVYVQELSKPQVHLELELVSNEPTTTRQGHLEVTSGKEAEEGLVEVVVEELRPAQRMWLANRLAEQRVYFRRAILMLSERIQFVLRKIAPWQIRTGAASAPVVANETANQLATEAEQRVTTETAAGSNEETLAATTAADSCAKLALAMGILLEHMDRPEVKTQRTPTFLERLFWSLVWRR